MAHKRVHNKSKSSKKSKAVVVPVVLEDILLEQMGPIESVDVDEAILDSLDSVDIIEEEIEHSDNIDETIESVKPIRRAAVEDILFKLPCVSNPLIGTPKQVQDELDNMVIKIQNRPNSKKSCAMFDRIHLYMHGYLINIVLRQFPYIKGMQTVDIYQQSLLALWQKAIPNFKMGKGMSFLNFAKMCIRRHLITILNASITRLKDQSINRAVSLDSSPTSNESEDDSNNTFSNIIPDPLASADKLTEEKEALNVTKRTLTDSLSDFEQVVVEEYLTGASYREIAKNISRRTNKRCVPKSVDNALLRIRKKAISLKKQCRIDQIPIFIS